MTDNLSPTQRMTETLQAAFDYFNQELFEGALPQVLLTLQRRRKFRGFFHHDHMVERGTERRLSEIALNPETFFERTPKEVLSTLVHEMVHLWQAEFGTPGKGGYHNAEWADAMEDVGLMPSTTALPGGARTGIKCSHYIMPDGDFDIIADEFLATRDSLTIFEDIIAAVDASAPTRGTPKTRFTCPSCAARVWGKPDLHILCGTCNTAMEA